MEYSAPNLAPYNATIAELMLRRGQLSADAATRIAEAQARAAENIGNIQAQTAMRNGQVRGAMFDTLGGTITNALEAPARQQAMQTVALEKQLDLRAKVGALNEQQAKAQDREDAQTFGQIKAASFDPATGLYDGAKAQQALQQTNNPRLGRLFAEWWPTAEKANDETRNASAARGKTEDAAIKEAAFGAQSYDEFKTLIAPHVARGTVNPAHLAELDKAFQQVAGHADLESQLLDHIAGVKSEFKPVGEQPGVFNPRTSTWTPQGPTVEDTKTEFGAFKSAFAKRAGAASWNALTPEQQQEGLAQYDARTGNNEPKAVTLPNGQTAMVVFDKRDPTKYTVVPGLKPPPSNAMIVRDATAAALDKIPEWARTGRRPDPNDPASNQIDKTIGETPNGLYNLSLLQIKTGQKQGSSGIGRSNPAMAAARQAAIDATVGAIAAHANMDPATFQAVYKANAASLSKVQGQADQVQGYMRAADLNAELLEQQLARIPDWGNKIANAGARKLADVFGSGEMAALMPLVQSVQSEYGRILNSGPNLNAVLTDSSRHEAQQLVDKNATVAQFFKSLASLKAEGTNRVRSLGEQMSLILGRMQNDTTGASGGGGTSGGVKVLSIVPVK